MSGNDGAVWVIAILVAILLATVVYFLPTYIAFKRNHAYRWVIFGINFVAGATVIGWLAAFIWAVYPSEKSFADPVLGNATGTGTRNVGHTLGEVNSSMNSASPGSNAGNSSLEAIERLAALLERKAITEEEFLKKKTELLKNV